MKDFVEKLKKEIRSKIGQIEAGDGNALKKALDASNVLGDAFSKLKEYIAHYRFADEAEKAWYIKEVKPRLFCRLVYYRNVYNIEMHRPVAGIEAQREYLKNKLDGILEFNNKILDFYLETFYYERDPQFSANCGFKVAKIMANDMLQAYLLGEMEKLDASAANPPNGFPGGSFPKVRLTWTGSKTELIELIYALDTDGCFDHGKVPLIQIAAYFENIFNTHLGSNIARNFYDMRIRRHPTPFLDRLRHEMLKRMENPDYGGNKDKNKK